jgi:hypothetical protein
MSARLIASICRCGFIRIFSSNRADKFTLTRLHCTKNLVMPKFIRADNFSINLVGSRQFFVYVRIQLVEFQKTDILPVEHA